MPDETDSFTRSLIGSTGGAEGAIKALAMINREKPIWIEPHSIAVRFGMPIAQAKLFLNMPGYAIKQKLYHNCCECPVGLFNAPAIPDEWECPECQQEPIEHEMWFEPVAVKIDRSNFNAMDN